MFLFVFFFVSVFVCVCVSCVCILFGAKDGARRVVGVERGQTHKSGRPEGWRPTFRAFFPLPLPISMFFLSLGVLSWNGALGECLGLSAVILCQPRRPTGVSHDDAGRPNAQILWAMALNHGHNSTRRPAERERDERMTFAAEHGKKSDILGGPAEGLSAQGTAGSGSRTPEMEAERLSAEAMPVKSEVDEKVLPLEEALDCSQESQGIEDVTAVKAAQRTEMEGGFVMCEITGEQQPVRVKAPPQKRRAVIRWNQRRRRTTLHSSKGLKNLVKEKIEELSFVTSAVSAFSTGPAHVRQLVQKEVFKFFQLAAIVTEEGGAAHTINWCKKCHNEKQHRKGEQPPGMRYGYERRPADGTLQANMGHTASFISSS